MPVKRVKAIVEYDGTGYCGFQKQKENVPTVQQEIEISIKNFSGENIEISASGRTDAGVHATGQVIHFDISKRFRDEEIQGAMNYFLRGKNIAILALEEVSDSFHVRFDALEREYLYKIICRRAPLALNLNRAWHVRYSLDVIKMQNAASLFLGRHDFSSFRASECQSRSPVRTINKINVEKIDDLIEISISAKSFLHNQVRIMVGALKEVGSGKWSGNDVLKALSARNRAMGPPTAPACGLYFARVKY